jgi:hypothetical protein
MMHYPLPYLKSFNEFSIWQNGQAFTEEEALRHAVEYLESSLAKVQREV